MAGDCGVACASPASYFPVDSWRDTRPRLNRSLMGTSRPLHLLERVLRQVFHAVALSLSVVSCAACSPLAVSSSRGYIRLAASESVTHLTRLETRTKESNMCASHGVLHRPRGVMKVKVGFTSAVLGSLALCGRKAPTIRPIRFIGWPEPERTRWDPKDGELCLGRTKPEETLVEVRSGSDVQIDRQTLV